MPYLATETNRTAALKASMTPATAALLAEAGVFRSALNQKMMNDPANATAIFAAASPARDAIAARLVTALAAAGAGEIEVRALLGASGAV